MRPARPGPARRSALAPGEIARLSFRGASGGVTGSCYLVRTRRSRVLVDCGMFQGGRKEESRNRRPFSFEPSQLDAVLLTHAHIDHCGLVPKLVGDGFRGRIHATRPTCDLLGIMLPDSAHIQEQDARQATKHSQRAGGLPVEPLYGHAEVERTLKRLAEQPFDEIVPVTEDLRVRFARAGHILGAASIEMWIADGRVERKLVFSGDVGRTLSPVIRDPKPPEDADLVLLESTYGDRDHKPLETSLDELAGILRAAAAERASVLVPVFAVGRAQEILYYIGVFQRSGRAPAAPVYLDSPMAIHVTELYGRHPDELDEPIRKAIEEGRGEELEPRDVHFCRTPQESMALNEMRGAIVLAASGMCEGGRILHHLKHHLWRPGTRVVLVGFQAQGTLGRRLVEGARRVRVLGQDVAVAATVHTLGGFSAHAGQSELVAWVRSLAASGAEIALTHGEDDRRRVLAGRLQGVARRPALLPRIGDAVSIRSEGAACVFEPARPSESRA